MGSTFPARKRQAWNAITWNANKPRNPFKAPLSNLPSSRGTVPLFSCKSSKVLWFVVSTVYITFYFQSQFKVVFVFTIHGLTVFGFCMISLFSICISFYFEFCKDIVVPLNCADSYICYKLQTSYIFRK